MRRVSYLALSLYLLFVGLSASVANLIIPNTLMAALALIASFGIFLEACLASKTEKSNRSESAKPKHSSPTQ